MLFLKFILYLSFKNCKTKGHQIIVPYPKISRKELCGTRVYCATAYYLSFSRIGRFCSFFFLNNLQKFKLKSTRLLSIMHLQFLYRYYRYFNGALIIISFLDIRNVTI